MVLNPPSQYADDRNLAARQRLWDTQHPPFDLPSWVVQLTGAAPGDRVLDVGCGNGRYLELLQAQGIGAVGCDLSMGMLRAAGEHALINGDVQALPVASAAFDVVLAPHMLYHVSDRAAGARELRRVLRPGGVCVVVTNGEGHMVALRRLVEAAVREVTPGWEMRNPSISAFSLENGAEQLAAAFSTVERVDPDGVAPVVVRDPDLVADYVASTGDHYAPEVDLPWPEVVAEVRRRVAAVIERDGAFIVRGEAGALVCR